MPASIVKSLARKTGKSIKDIEKLWDKAIEISAKSGIKQNSSNFYAYAVGILKRMVKETTLLKKSPEELIELYTDGTPHRLRSEPRNSASTIFKRDKFLRRRNEKDKEKSQKKS